MLNKLDLMWTAILGTVDVKIMCAFLAGAIAMALFNWIRARDGRRKTG